MQTVETLIRRRILWRLIWVCTVCQLPFYGSPDYNGLKQNGKVSVKERPYYPGVPSKYVLSQKNWFDSIWMALVLTGMLLFGWPWF